jgi:DNA mismatch repair protein MutL
LGFRGEALAVIAAVSQLTVVSKAKGEKSGVRLTLEGGTQTSRETVGAPQGTVIAVTNLFYNVPARLKFLKSDSSEKRLIDEYISRYALAYPKIRFRLTHNNRITFQSSGSDDIQEVLAAIYGPDIAKRLLIIDWLPEPNRRPEQDEMQHSEGHDQVEAKASSGDSINVSGYVSPPDLNWGNRKHIVLFVNGRWIKDHRLSYAIIQAYHTLLPVGRFPLAVIFLEVPVTSVDVNVHPAKTEVRFRRVNAVFGALQRAVRETVMAESPVPHAHFSSLQPPAWPNSASQQVFTKRDENLNQSSLSLDWSAGQSEDNVIGQSEQTKPEANLGGERLPVMRVIGQVGASYIITEGPEGMFLIDQHAAHERILYERFMRDWKVNNGQQAVASQGLVSGVVVQLSPSQTSLLNEQIELLEQIGFQLESFGPNAYMVRSVPAILTKLDPAKALLDVVEDLERGEAPLQGKIEEQIILRVCKSAAIKAGQTLSLQEMEAMVRQLESCSSPHTCPHGRPTLIHLSVAQLAKEFGRT